SQDQGNLGVVLGGGSSLDFIVEYSDPSLVNRARLGTGDIIVLGPGGYSQVAQFVSADSEANAQTIRVRYRITAPGGTWDTIDNGTYTIMIQANEVADANSVPNYVPAG